MKRRLSVAISAIGNPKVIFFDEPTTGMDPVSRRDVWVLMQSLKKSKTIIKLAREISTITESWINKT